MMIFIVQLCVICSECQSTNPSVSILERSYLQFTREKNALRDIEKKFGVEIWCESKMQDNQLVFYRNPKKGKDFLFGKIEDSSLQEWYKFDWKSGSLFDTLPGMPAPRVYLANLLSDGKDETILTYSLNKGGAKFVVYESFAAVFNSDGKTILSVKIGEANWVDAIQEKAKFLYLKPDLNEAGWFRESMLALVDLNGDENLEIVAREKKFVSKPATAARALISRDNFLQTYDSLKVFKYEPKAGEYALQAGYLDTAGAVTRKLIKGLKW